MFLAEKGQMTVRKRKDLLIFPVNTDGTFRTVKWPDAWDFSFYLREADHGRKTVIIDTASAAVSLCRRYIQKDQEARDEAREPGITTQPTWNRIGTEFTEWMEELETICATRSMHLIYTAQERWVSDTEEEEKYPVPDFSPSVRSFITEKPSILARTFLEEDEDEEDENGNPLVRYGITFRDPELLVGERVTPRGEKPWLPRYAYNTTIPGILKMIRSKSNG